MWRLEFDTDKFLPYLPEECQSNPGAYGFELAHWLSHQLASRGLVTGYPLGEDWGWFIEYLDGETEITIGCNSEAGDGDGYKGIAIHWRVFVRQPLSLKQRLRGSGSPAKVHEIATAVAALLRSEGIAVNVSEA
jgi:hypothetical protein